MRKIMLIAFLFALTANLFAQKNNTDKRLAGIDTSLSRLLKEWKIAGFAVAIVEKDKIIYSNGFGYSDYENKKPATANTLFAIGSCTKAFTSSLLGIAAKEGKVSLDKKATDYLPALRFFNDKMNNDITVRDMMSHRTGLPRHDYAWYLFNTSSRDTLLQRIRYQEPNAGLREKWQYNNFMFLLQGMITEKISGRSWEDNIKEKIFAPLGMTRSNLSVTVMAKDADASVGYYVKNDSLIKKLDYYNIDGMGPAGSINSSVNEMANWVITWINEGKFKGKEILPSNYVRDAISSQMTVAGGLPDTENPDLHFSNYGLGWFLSSYRGHYRVEHGGNIDGFSASTSYFPSDSIGIIVLTNQNGSAVPSVARNIIADRMLKLKYINWSSNRKKAADNAAAQGKEAEKTKISDKVPGTKPSHALSGYEGLFIHPGYGEIDITLRNDSLFAKTSTDSLYLRHYHYDVFEAKGFDKTDGLDTSAGGLRLTFRSNQEGKIESVLLPLEGSLKPIEFQHHPKPKATTAAELQKYTGEYDLPGAVVKVYIKNNTLFVLVPGQPDYETIATGNHTFKLKSLEGYSVKFEVTDQNEVPSVSFIQPNGVFKAPKKK